MDTSKLTTGAAAAPRTAVEFFSGIGGFAEAARGTNLKILAAYDQDLAANQVYAANFGLEPRSRNLDSITAGQIPEADLWWMSPPCRPYSVRGNRKDAYDSRAASFLNLIELLDQCRPSYVLMENVRGFIGSIVHKRFLERLSQCNYGVQEFDLCSTDFGVPMKRPRHFIVASSHGFVDSQPELGDGNLQPLSKFLSLNPDPELMVDPAIMARYGQALNVVDPSLCYQVAICLTSGYFKCQKASGSFIKLDQGKIRRFSAEEILRLLGFADHFRFPDNHNLSTRFRLLGNSVDVRSVRSILKLVVMVKSPAEIPRH